MERRLVVVRLPLLRQCCSGFRLLLPVSFTFLSFLFLSFFLFLFVFFTRFNSDLFTDDHRFAKAVKQIKPTTKWLFGQVARTIVVGKKEGRKCKVAIKSGAVRRRRRRSRKRRRRAAVHANWWIIQLANALVGFVVDFFCWKKIPIYPSFEGQLTERIFGRFKKSAD